METIFNILAQSTEKWINQVMRHMTSLMGSPQQEASWPSVYTCGPLLVFLNFNLFTCKMGIIVMMLAMAPHSSTLAWKTPWTEETGRLQSMGSRRVGHDWATSLSLFTFNALEKEMATHSSVLAWRIPGTGEPCLWGRTESDTTEVT